MDYKKDDKMGLSKEYVTVALLDFSKASCWVDEKETKSAELMDDGKESDSVAWSAKLLVEHLVGK